MKKPSRRHILKMAASLPMLGMLPRQAWAQATSSKRLIIVRAFGGWDVTYCMDPRLTTCSIHGPDFDPGDRRACDGVGAGETIETFSGGGLRIMLNQMRRPSVGQFFQQNADQTVVINGISVGSIVHEECRHRIVTGNRDKSAADMGTLTAVSFGGMSTLPYLDLTGGAQVGPYAAHTGMLGRNNQIIALVDRNLMIPGIDGRIHPIHTPSDEAKAAIRGYLAGQRQQWRMTNALDPRSEKIGSDYEAAVQRKADLVGSRDLLKENLSFGSSGNLIEQNETVVALMKAGICHSATLETPISWDTHDDITQQHGLYEMLFGGLNDLVTRLKAAELYDETLIVVVSEMTRTPKMNQDGGKDHWPVTSAMLIGGSLAGGRTLGGTNDYLDAQPTELNSGVVSMSSSRKIEYPNFAAGVLHAAGVDTASFLPGVEVLRGIIDEG